MENSNSNDKNVGSIEETINTIEKMIKSHKEADKCGLSNNDFKNETKALEHILSDYKKLQEEFKQVDHECSRLEKKEIKLEKENYSLQCQYDKALEDLVKEFKVKQELKGKLKELKVKWEEMRPYRDISPHDFGYISGEIDILTEILSR